MTDFRRKNYFTFLRFQNLHDWKFWITLIQFEKTKPIDSFFIPKEITTMKTIYGDKTIYDLTIFFLCNSLHGHVIYTFLTT